MLNILLTILISYLIGSIPFSYYVAKQMGKIDVREHGSKNAGATNVYRVLGAKAGITALLLDISKGVITVLLIQTLFSYELSLLAAVIVISGHCYPYLLNFKGGKGIATGVGAVFALAPFTALLLVICFIIIVALTGYVSLGSVLSAALLPVISYYFGEPMSFFYFAIPIALFVIYKHKANIKRLFKGEESKISTFRKK